MSQISKEIFDKIRTRFSNVELGDAEGKTTLDSDQAVFFEFDYKDRGSVVLNLQDDLMKIYFNNKMVKEMDSDQSDNWHAWLRNMRKYAHANMLNFEVKNIDKQRLDRKDFEYLVKTSGEQEELTMESKMYGSKQKSYQDLNGARMIVKHARTVDEEKRGARSRNISAVYIENDQGERFKFPNTYLPAARAMTRHVSNGGYPNDERGKHILDIMAEMMDLRKFSRRTKRTEYTEEAHEIIKDATDRYYGLKDTLEGMKKQTGYETYFENWAPDQIEVDENDIEDLKIKLTREVFDDELSDTLGNVGKAVAMGKIKREEEEDRIGSEAASLKAFATGPDPIMMHPNPEGDADVRNYQTFIKNSNMPLEKRNLAMVQRIMMELSNRMVDDALAAAIGRLDMDNNVDAATAFAMAKKYLKGETEIQQPKAKKDRYGKDKVESWDDYERAIEEGILSSGDSWYVLQDAKRLAAADGKDLERLPYGEAQYYMKKAEEMQSESVGASAEEEDEFHKKLDKLVHKTFGHSSDEKKKKVGKQEEVKEDESDAARELILYGENDGDLYRQRTVPIQKNLSKKFAKGVYDSELAKKLWMYWATDAAKRYARDHSTGDDWNRIFSVAVRKEVAEYMEDYWRQELEAGNAMESVKEEEEGYEQQEGASMEEVANAISNRIMNDEDLMKQALQKAGGIEGLMAAIDEVAADYAGVEELGSGDISVMTHEVLKDIGVKEGKMNNLDQHIEDMIQDGATDEEIMAMHPEVKQKYLDQKRMDSDEKYYDESLDRMKAIAGIGSNAKSNHGIRLGEEGYQITPRSIVAREMRKLQDLEAKSLQEKESAAMKKASGTASKAQGKSLGTANAASSKALTKANSYISK